MADDRDDDDEPTEEHPKMMDPILELLQMLAGVREKTRPEAAKTNPSGGSNGGHSGSSTRSGSRSSVTGASSTRTTSQSSHLRRTASNSTTNTGSSYAGKSDITPYRPVDDEDDNDDDDDDFVWTPSNGSQQTTKVSGTPPLVFEPPGKTSIKEERSVSVGSGHSPTSKAKSSSNQAQIYHSPVYSQHRAKYRSKSQPPNCGLLSLEMASSSQDMCKIVHMQVEDTRKSFDQRAKMVATMRSFRVQLADSIKHAIAKTNGSKSN